MTFLHRAPREVYRVYGEEEYLAGEHDGVGEQSPGSEPDRQTDQPVISSGPRGSHAARLLGLGLLAGVTLGAVGLVLSSLSHRAPVTPESVVHPKARVPGHRSPARSAPMAASVDAGSAVGDPTGVTLAYPPKNRSVSRATEPRPSVATSRPITLKYIVSYPRSISFRSARASRQWLSPRYVLGGIPSATAPDGEFGFER